MQNTCEQSNNCRSTLCDANCMHAVMLRQSKSLLLAHFVLLACSLFCLIPRSNGLRSHLGLNSEGAGRLRASVCTPTAFGKQTCRFHDVCLQIANGTKTIKAILVANAPQQAEQLAVLKQHIKRAVHGHFHQLDVSIHAVDARELANFTFESRPTLLWHENVANQGSFGHALINEAFPMFLVVQEHLATDIPTDMQLIIMGEVNPVLHRVLSGMITPHLQRLVHRLASVPPGTAGICFRTLITGDGGYVHASRASLTNSNAPHAKQYGEEPTFFSSFNWWQFRRHVLKVNNITTGTLSQTRPLILLNDKRHGPNASADRRMILNIDEISANLTVMYPAAEVRAIRFRDLTLGEQVRWLSRASVFITTQASSSFGLVFLPKGATCIMVGAPQSNTKTVWTSFYELDHWFPLTYVNIQKYSIPLDSNGTQYEVKVLPGAWQPPDVNEVGNWWLYNANVWLMLDRLKVMLDPVFGAWPAIRLRMQHLL